MKLITYLSASLLLAIILPGCNPECESPTNRNIVVANGTQAIPGQQVLLRSNPTEFMRDRRVFYDTRQDNGTSRRLQVSETTFENELGGLVVTLPENIEFDNEVPLFVDDPDCSESFIPISGLQVQDLDQLYLSGALVVPPIPIVIVPIPTVNPPINVTNAWISPYDRNYCVWFVPLRDDECNELNELRPWKQGDPEKVAMDADNFLAGSRELLTGCLDQPQRSNTNTNPITGSIDKANNKILIQIDRTSKGLDVESFSGMFIDAATFAAATDGTSWTAGGLGDCSAAGTGGEPRAYMLLTSLQTGQQLVLMQLSAVEDGAPKCRNE